MKRIRLFLLKQRNPRLSVGRNVRIDRGTCIDIRNNKLTIGNNVYLRSKRKGYHAGMPFPTAILIDKEGAECEIGDNCRINGAYIHAQSRISIGRNTVVASGVNIIDSNGHVTKSLNRTIGRDIPEEIIIGENVWIGLNAIVLKGTSIGENSVVAAGSVVQGAFPPSALIKGNPAILVKILSIEDVAITHVKS